MLRNHLIWFVRNRPASLYLLRNVAQIKWRTYARSPLLFELRSYVRIIRTI
jgi:hypothetical protein